MTPLVPGTLVALVGILAAALFIYLGVAAVLLKRAFSAGARSTAPTPELLARRIRPIAALYGGHLLLYIALGYLILILTLLIAIDIFPAALWLLSNLKIPSLGLILLPSAALLIAIISLWAVLHGLLARNQPAGDFELRADPYRQGPLFAICAEVAAAIGTPRVDQVVLSGRPGISVREEGDLLTMLVGRPKRTLLVGSPSLIHLTVGQFRAILAQELGHLSDQDAAWTSLTFRAGSAVECARRNTALSRRLGAWRIILTLLNPAYLLILAYTCLYHHLTLGFSRTREILADEAACRLYGPQTFGEALRRVVLNDALFNLMFRARLPHYAAETNDVPARAFVALDREYRTTSTHQLLVLWDETIGQRPSAFDPHPPPQERFRRAASYPRHFELAAATSEDDDLRIADLIGWTATRPEPVALSASLQQIEVSSASTHLDGARSLA